MAARGLKVEYAQIQGRRTHWGGNVEVRPCIKFSGERWRKAPQMDDKDMGGSGGVGVK